MFVVGCALPTHHFATFNATDGTFLMQSVAATRAVHPMIGAQGVLAFLANVHMIVTQWIFLKTIVAII